MWYHIAVIGNMDTPSRPILWQVTDPRGLSIILAQDSWEHAILHHREIADYLPQVQLTCQDPDAIYYDPKSTESRDTGATVYWYVKRNLLSGALQNDLLGVVVKVVVEDNSRQGYVSTALPIDKPQTRLVLQWKKS